MVLKIVFSEYAKLEVEDAVTFYQLQLKGLGGVFREEVKKAVIRLATYPLAWPVERGEIRKCLLHKFPYKVLYSVEEDHIFIIAIAHQHQKPNYWADRDDPI